MKENILRLKRVLRATLFVLLLNAVGLTKVMAQQPPQVKVSEINLSNIETIEERVFIVHSILENGYFCFNNTHLSNTIDIFVSSEATDEMSDFDFFYDNVIYEQLHEYRSLDKTMRGELFVQWRQGIDNEVFRALYEDFTRGIAPVNATCENALPFTANGAYSFSAGVNSGSPCGDVYNASCSDPYHCNGNHQGQYNCLSTAPNPAFYYIRITSPGDLNIYMESTPAVDIDFDCWGPFNNVAEACGQLSCSNIVDCSYSINPTENCHINNAQAGEYYILLITNYSNNPCEITFENIGTGSSGELYISAEASPLEGGTVTGTGYYSNGETCTLTATPASGYSFVKWTKNGTQVSTNSTYSFTVTESASYVAHFSQNSYTISALANPSNAGTVTGYGTYAQGVTCILTATANNGYAFDNWKENGTVVSTSSTYSFTVTGPRTLVAHFNQIPNTGNIVFADANVKALCVANWDTDDDGELSYAEAAAVTELGEVFKNNATITSFDELQYFTGLTAIGERAFYNCYNLTSVVIPNSVTAIDQNAFAYCYYLTSVELSNALTTIGQNAFYDSYRLASIHLPSTVTTIGNSAFSYCYGLVSLDIPASVASIGNDAFNYCTGLEQITVTEGNEIFDSRDNCNAIIETATNTLRFGCKNSTIPNTVTTLGDYAFRYMDIPSVNIPESVVSIGTNVFGGCSVLEQITVAEGNSVFDSRDNCNAAIETGTNKLVFGCKNTVIPNTVTTIGQYAFCNCSSLTSIVIPNTVTIIGQSAFYNCYSLTSIVIPNSVTAIDQIAFAYCYYLTTVVLSNSLTTIGASAFYDCYRLNSITIPSTVVTIGNYAFSYCYGLVSVEIPASVTSIGNNAFAFCSGLASITSLSQNPPTLGNNVFSNVDKSIPVYVPCISMYAYQNASGWDEFTNITSSSACNSGEITITVNPTEGGTVTGGGYYEGGAVCTLTATANEGYLFINWTKDGEEVSNSETYSFNVDGDATYVANFEQGVVIGSGTATNQYLPSYSYYCYSFSQQIYTADEIGRGGAIASIAFFNAGATKTRSYNVYMVHTDKLSFENSTDWITVSENDLVFSGEITMTADTWTRLLFDIPFQYDGVSNIALAVDDNSGNYTGSPHMACNVFEAQGNQAIRIYSDGTNYDPYNPSVYGGTLHSEKNQIRLGLASTPSTITQTTTLSRGWNWYSTYIEQEGINGLGQLENSIGVPDAIIQSQYDGYVKSGLRNGVVIWRGALASINNEEMYKIGTKRVRTTTMEGQITDPANHPITIYKGWNWIGFPCSQSVSVNEALSGFTPKNGDAIKGIHSYATYNNGTWSGTLNTLEPGQGYMYGSKDRRPKTLVYQTSRGDATLANITPANNFYQPVEDYADNMTITAVIELDGEEMRSADFELAAFAGDECRGSVKLMYVAPIDRYVAFLTVFGDQEDALRFVLTDGMNMNQSVDQLTFGVDNIAGSLDEPVVLRFGTTGVNENLAANVRIYPNPSEGLFNIEGNGIRKVEVFNALGQPVYSTETENDFLKLDLTNRAAGVYLIRVITDDGIQSYQVMKR